MLLHRYCTTFILLFFSTACQGYSYGNDTSVETLDARDLEARAGPDLGTGSEPHKLRIVAVGDVHGDYDRFLNILKYLEVVDQHGMWSGKVDVFVQLGDLMDRGPYTIKLFEYLDKLRVQAVEKDGRVYTLLGNHEVKNLMYQWDDVSDRELESFGFIRHEQSRRQAFTSSGAIGQSLANNFLGALLLPLYPNKPVNTPYEQEKEKESQFSHSAIAFVHGGLCPSTYEELLPFPTLINTIAKDLVARLQGFLAANTKKLRFEEATLTAREKLLCHKGRGPLWYRGLAERHGPDCAEVEKMLKKIGARRIVIGHTPNGERIVEKCNGRIIVIDTGITRWERVKSSFLTSKKQYTWVEGTGGMSSALDIRYNFDDEGKQTEVVHAVYPGLKKPHDSVQLSDIPFKIK